METEYTLNYQLQILEDYIKKYYPTLTGSHFIDLIDIIYMAAIRNNINISNLCNDLFKGILDLDKFRNSKNGNIYDFIKDKKYIVFTKRIKDITVGSNGGMASVGKGEWLLSLSAGINPVTEKPHISIIKNGAGDLEYEDTKNTEELKWNGGKVSVDKSGQEVTRVFNKIIVIKDKFWVPFRKNDKKLYTEENKQKNNAVYWQAISGEKYNLLSDNELKAKIIHMSYEKVFEKCNTFIMFNDDGRFQRFLNIQEADNYYKNKYDKLTGRINTTDVGFEVRAKQNNPPALYCYVF
jgi:hypothetical protein